MRVREEQQIWKLQISGLVFMFRIIASILKLFMNKTIRVFTIHKMNSYILETVLQST